MKKTIISLFFVSILSMIVFAADYIPPTYNNVVLTLENTYVAPSYTNIVLVLNGGVTPGPTNTCSNFATTGYINCADGCNITTNTFMLNSLLINGTGYVNIYANITTNQKGVAIKGINSTDICRVSLYNSRFN